jgi:hypothetical protein
MSLPPVNAEDALKLHLAWHGSTLQVLAPDFQNIPTLVVPAPDLRRTAFLDYFAVTDDSQIRSAASRLDNPQPLLMLVRPNLDGPPFRTGTLFCYVREENVSWRAGSISNHSLRTEVYEASTSRGSSNWLYNGKPGYFLTGTWQKHELWRVARLETDAAYRYLFTLAPLRLAHGLPEVQFSALTSPTLRAEAERHWSEFQNQLVAHQYYALVTSAKNVAETVLADYLSQTGLSSRRDFDEMLGKLRDMLNAPKTETGVPFDFMDYHLMQKIRLLHGRTHSGQVARMGRATRPELALTVAEDLVEVLTSLGLASETR